jgi:MFS family permease
VQAEPIIHADQRATVAPRYILFILTLMSALSFMDRQILAVMIEPIKSEFALSDLQIGVVTGFGFALTFGLLGVPLGRVADRRNRRSLIAVCRGLGSLISTLGAGVAGFWQLAFTRVGGALSEAGGAPASMSMIADLYPLQQRSRAMSVFALGASVGALMALIVGGWLAQRYGWRATLAIIGLTSLALTLLFRFSIDEPARGAGGAFETSLSAGVTPQRSVVREIWRTPVTRWLIVAAAFVLLVGYSFGAWNFTFLVRSHGLSLQKAGFISSLAAVGAVFGSLFSGALTDHLARRDQRWQIGVPILGVSLALPIGLIYFMMPYGQVLPAAMLLVAFSFFITWWVAPTYAALSLAVPANKRATASAMVLLAGSILGSGAGPILTGWFSDFLTPLARGEALRYALASGMALLLVAIMAFSKALVAYPAARQAILDAGSRKLD